MTGIDFGFGNLIIYSIYIIILVPLVSIILINQINSYKKLKYITKQILNILIFIGISYISLIIIRHFHAKSFQFFLCYLFIVTITILSLKYKGSLFYIFIIGNILLLARFLVDPLLIACEPCLTNTNCLPCRTEFAKKIWIYFITYNILIGILFIIKKKQLLNKIRL